MEQSFSLLELAVAVGRTVLFTDILQQRLSHNAQQRRPVAVVALPNGSHMQCPDAGASARARDRRPILGRLGFMHTSLKTQPA